MIKSRDVHKVLSEREIQFKTIERKGTKNVWFQVTLKPTVISSNDINYISKALNEALVILHIGEQYPIMCIHPYYKNY